MILIALLLAGAGIADGQSQTALNVRADHADQVADSALNDQWRVTLAAMRRMDATDPAHGGHGPGYADAALASQRAWLAFRNAECTAEGMHFAGGSAQGMAVSACLATLTRQRTAQLKALSR